MNFPPDLASAPQAQHRLRPLVTLGAAGLLLAVIWTGTYTAVRAHRSLAEARLASDVAAQTLQLETRLQDEVAAAGQALRLLAPALRHGLDKVNLVAWQHAAAAPGAPPPVILAADAGGIVRASTAPGLLGIDVSDQDYFRAARARASGDDTLARSALRQGGLPWQWRLTQATRLTGADGAFAGIAAATIDTAPLAGSVRPLDPDADELIALMSLSDSSLHLLAGNGENEAEQIPLPGSGLAAAIVAAPDGTWSGILRPGGVERLVAFRRVPDSDLAALIAVDHAEAMQPVASWAAFAWTLAGAASALILVAAGLVLWFEARARQRNIDLTQANAALARRVAQLDATLAGMGDGIMILDAELRLVEWNVSFPELTGVPREVLQVGTDMRTILRAQALGGEFGDVDVDAEVKRRMASLTAGGSSGMMQRLRPNGRVLELRRNPLPDGGFVTLYTDVTARHAMEQRLQQSQKMAAVGRLTAGVAHDFNNLLATIVGSAELLERQAGRDPAVARRLELIMQAAGRGSDLVRQLLAFAKQQPLEPVLVDLNTILDGMAALLRATLGSSIRVETRLAVGLWPALVDPVQIEHVILNLAINARDAMADGGSLTVTTANLILAEPRSGLDVLPGEYVTVALTDTGTGMSDDVLRKVFEPFFTTKGPGRGSGLGLSQVYGVASQSGGGVEIISRFGQGTTVRVFLPRGEPEASQAPTGRLGDARSEDRRPTAARRHAAAG